MCQQGSQYDQKCCEALNSGELQGQDEYDGCKADVN